MRRRVNTGPGTMEIGTFLRSTLGPAFVSMVVAIRAKRHGGQERAPTVLATSDSRLVTSP